MAVIPAYGDEAGSSRQRRTIPGWLRLYIRQSIQHRPPATQEARQSPRKPSRQEMSMHQPQPRAPGTSSNRHTPISSRSGTPLHFRDVVRPFRGFVLPLVGDDHSPSSLSRFTSMSSSSFPTHRHLLLNQIHNARSTQTPAPPVFHARQCQQHHRRHHDNDDTDADASDGSAGPGRDETLQGRQGLRGSPCMFLLPPPASILTPNSF